MRAGRIAAAGTTGTGAATGTAAIENRPATLNRAWLLRVRRRRGRSLGNGRWRRCQINGPRPGLGHNDAARYGRRWPTGAGVSVAGWAAAGVAAAGTGGAATMGLAADGGAGVRPGTGFAATGAAGDVAGGRTSTPAGAAETGDWAATGRATPGAVAGGRTSTPAAGGFATTGPEGGLAAMAGVGGGGATTILGSCRGSGTMRRGAGGGGGATRCACPGRPAGFWRTWGACAWVGAAEAAGADGTVCAGYWLGHRRRRRAHRRAHYGRRSNHRCRRAIRLGLGGRSYGRPLIPAGGGGSFLFPLLDGF